MSTMAIDKVPNHPNETKVAEVGLRICAYVAALTVISSFIVGRSSLDIDQERYLRTYFTPEDELLNQGGWLTKKSDILVPPGPCNIPIVEESLLSNEQFLKHFAYKTPVVIRFGYKANEEFRKMCEKAELLRNWGRATVRLSSANTYSADTKDVFLKHYVEKMTGPQDIDMLANETFYFFGYNDMEEWQDFFEMYRKPPYHLPKHSAAYSFGLAGPQTGVPFHFHGPGFAETLHGRKRWFLTPHEVVPEFSPNKTTLQWFKEDYDRVKDKMDLYECTVSPGEAIYFPDRWWHATLNIDAAVFISTFLSP